MVDDARYRADPHSVYTSLSRSHIPEPRGSYRIDTSHTVGTEEYDRVACHALGLAQPGDQQNGTTHYHLGSFNICESEGAVAAVVNLYRIRVSSRFYTFREYRNAVKTVSSIKSEIRREEGEIVRGAEGRLKEIQHGLDAKGFELSNEARGTLARIAIAPHARAIEALDEKFYREHQFIQTYSFEHFSDTLAGYIYYIFRVEQPLFTILNRGVLAFVPAEPFKYNGYVCGTIRSGKTELLKAVIHGATTQPYFDSVVALDPAGDFVDQVAKWPEFVGNDRLIYIKYDLLEGMVPTINPLDQLAMSGVDYNDTSRGALTKKRVVAQELLSAFEEIIAGGQGSNITTPMRTLLMPCLLTLLDRPGSTLIDLQRFMVDEDNDDLVAFARTLDHYQNVPSFFAQKFKGKGGAHFAKTKASIYGKLQDLFNTGIFTELTCRKSTIDLETALNGNKILLFNLAKGSIGSQESRAFGRLVVAMMQSIAMRRVTIPLHKRPKTLAVIDECHNLLTKSVSTILTETRKFGLSMLMAQQNLGQDMTPKMWEIVGGTTNIKIAGVIEADLQDRTAKIFPIDSKRFDELQTAKFFMRAGRVPTFKLHARSDLADNRNQMTSSSWERLVRRQIRSHYRPAIEPEHTTVDAPGTTPPKTKSRQRRRKQV